MISLEKVRTAVDFNDVLARSPVRDIPGADRTLRDTLTKSVVVWVGKVDGEIACVWGLIPPTILSEQAYLWLLTTELVEQHKFLFVRHSQRAIEILLDTYPVITGVTSATHEDAIRWLKWLGAEYEPGDAGMLNFVIRKKPNG